jgi:ADP-ribose pyrophosphatase
MDERRVEILERSLVYDGYFKIFRYRLRHSAFAGGMSPELTRELFERGQAAAVLPYDPVRDFVTVGCVTVSPTDGRRSPRMVRPAT